MKRRQLLTGFCALGAAALYPHSVRDARLSVADDIEPPLFDPLNDRENRWEEQVPQDVVGQALASNEEIQPADLQVLPIQAPPEEAQPQRVVSAPAPVASSKSTINKNIDFAKDYVDDIFVSADEVALLHSVTLRLKNLQSTIGYGNFNIVSFDDALAFARRFKQVGEFTAPEKDFIEKLFFFNANDYGFYGQKVTEKLTDAIKKPSTFKVPYTGHYLFKDQSFAYYEKIRKSVGEGIILTSGIRSNVKQLHLFLAKVIRVNGNLSRASRSLAPPGYSYHGIGDFDVGRKGWGGKNFTDAFSQTDEFKRMRDLGYVAIRYDEGNQLGVRFEPWHIKVV